MPAKFSWEHKGYSRVAKNRGYSDTLCKENERTCSNLWGVNRRAHRERVALDWQLSLGNMVGSKKLRKIFKDRALGLAAPSWSMSALVRHHGILVQRHPMLSAWKEAD